MQISIGLPSRNRPLDMIASVVSLFRMASGTNDVRVTVAVDADDTGTNKAVAALEREYPASILVLDRPHGLGELHNRMAADAPDDAVFICWSDRLQVLQADWDRWVAVSAMQAPTRVLWIDSVHLTGAGQFVLPPAWRAAQGPPCPGIFPAWFEDTAVEEVDAFVHGFPRVIVPAQCGGVRRYRTTRLRDLALWIDLFAAMRRQRVADAREIARKLGVRWQHRPDIEAHFEARDHAFRKRAAQLERDNGDQAPPDDTYLAAKARAEAMLAELRT